MKGVTVVEVVRDVRPGVGFGVGPVSPDVEGWRAEVELGSGDRMSFSRLDGEDVWLLDAHFGPDGQPHRCEGFGSRVTVKSVASGWMVRLFEGWMFE